MNTVRDFILKNKEKFSYDASLESLNFLLANRGQSDVDCYCLAGVTVYLLTEVDKVDSFMMLFECARDALNLTDFEAEFLFLKGNHLRFFNFNADKYPTDVDEVLGKLDFYGKIKAGTL